jgi:selenide,water dikinase
MESAQLEKRRRIMKRSASLGHCVCNPLKPCPCDVFRQYDVCECAGERRPVEVSDVKLTEHVRNTGCSSKISKNDLEKALAGLPDVDDPRIVVGRSAGDDAGVIDLGNGSTILTVDVFSPSVDDPYTFGQIAAANSVSDVYAMGGSPESALSIIGFPVHSLPLETMHQILRGGVDKMAEAGISVIGGHSINDEEVKFGFAVMGSSPQGEYVANDGAQEGDVIVLTKPLGVGIVTFARQVGRAPEGALEEVAASMSALNKLAAELMKAKGAHAATDVTGFSFVGHLANVARSSNVEVEVDFDALPQFGGVKDLARMEVLPGAVERNIESIDEAMLDLSALALAQRHIMFCPETSGGLLVFLPKERGDEYVAELRAGGVAHAAVVGRVVGTRSGGFIRAVTEKAIEYTPVKPVRMKPQPGGQPATDGNDCCAAAAPAEKQAECCAGGPPAEEAPECCAGGAPEADSRAPESRAAGAPPSSEARGIGKPRVPAEIADAFKQYSAVVNAPGAIDVKHKKLIAIALAVVSKCEPCVKLIADAARKAGATDDEIGEAIALGISFGGAAVNMFYQQLRM